MKYPVHHELRVPGGSHNRSIAEAVNDHHGNIILISQTPQKLNGRSLHLFPVAVCDKFVVYASAGFPSLHDQFIHPGVAQLKSIHFLINIEPFQHPVIDAPDPYEDPGHKTYENHGKADSYGTFHTAPLLFCHFKLVSHTPNGLDILTLIPHLAAQFLHMGVYGPGISKIIVIPHIVQNLFPGQGDPLVIHKV